MPAPLSDKHKAAIYQRITDVLEKHATGLTIYELAEILQGSEWQIRTRLVEMREMGKATDNNFLRDRKAVWTSTSKSTTPMLRDASGNFHPLLKFALNSNEPSSAKLMREFNNMMLRTYIMASEVSIGAEPNKKAYQDVRSYLIQTEKALVASLEWIRQVRDHSALSSMQNAADMLINDPECPVDRNVLLAVAKERGLT